MGEGWRPGTLQPSRTSGDHIIDGFLINVGNAAQWLWVVIKAFFGGVCSFLGWVLNPVLAPVLGVLNPVCTAINDTVYTVLSPLPVWLGLTVLAAIIGAFAMVAFRYTSNQTAIGRWRDQMTANLYVLLLYKDDIVVTFKAQGRLFAAMARWQWHMLRPLIILVILLLPVFTQMATRYQWRPLEPGEETLIRLQLAPEHNNTPTVMLQASAGLSETLGPVAGGGELVWRVHAGEPGRHTLRFSIDDAIVEKELVIGGPFQRVSAERPTWRWTDQLLYPVEPPIPDKLGVECIRIEYPGVSSYIYGADWWAAYLVVVSMLAALVLLPFFKVRI